MLREIPQSHSPDMSNESKTQSQEFDWQNGVIPADEVSISATRSGGPGGQSVNTTASKVEVRWNVGASCSLSQEQKMSIRKALKNRINKNDELIVTSETERSQKQNKEEALNKLSMIVRDALTPIIERIETKKPKRIKARERRASEAEKKRKAARKQFEDW